MAAVKALRALLANPGALAGTTAVFTVCDAHQYSAIGKGAR